MSDPRREAWLAERRQLLTASDVAAVLGQDPRRGPLAVWADKVHGITSEENAPMRRGRRLEAAVAEEYSELTGRPAIAGDDPYRITRHPEIPWLGATLDRTTIGCAATPAPASGPAPLQLKAVSGMKASEWRDEPPTPYLIQVQIEIACTGAEWGSLAALVGGLTVVWKDLIRHERFLAKALPRLEAFWLQVRRREAPEADGSEGTTDALKTLYAEEDGETVELDDDAVGLADALDRHRRREAEERQHVRELANKLRRRIGSATFGALPDGSYLSLKTQEREAYTVEETEYRVLKRFWPRLRRRS